MIPNRPRSSRAGISLGLHDYDRNAINKGHALKFKNAGPEEYNKYVGNDNGAYTGIVNKTLTNDGYPTMALIRNQNHWTISLAGSLMMKPSPATSRMADC